MHPIADLQTLISDAGDKLQAFRNVIQQSVDEDARLRAERSKIVSALAPADDVDANMAQTVKPRYSRLIEQYGRAIVRSFAGGLKLEYVPAHPSRVDPATDTEVVRRIPPEMPRLADTTSMLDVVLLILGPEAFIAGLGRVIQAAHPGSAGVPLDQRPAALAECDAAIAANEAEHTALVDAAAQLAPPIMIELLPAVRKRRELAAQKARDDAEAREVREAQQWQLDDQHRQVAAAARRTSGQSEYLRSGGANLSDRTRV